MQCGRWLLAGLKTSLGLYWQYPGQQLILGTAVVSVLVSWGSVLVWYPLFYRYAANVLITIGLLGGGLLVFDAVRATSKFRLLDGWVASSSKALLILYGLANVSLVSNADSLDYHLGYALNYLRQPFEPYPDWYTGRMAQAGEKVIALGLAFQSQSFAGLLQYAGLVALATLIANMPRFHNTTDYNDVSDNQDLLYLAWVSSPVLLFLSTSAKPQLMPTAMSGLAFVLVARSFLGSFLIGEAQTGRSSLFALLIAIALAAVAATHKSSFLISLTLLGCLSIYTAYRMGILRRFLLWAVVICFVIFLPVYLDKYQRYHSTPYAFLASPVGGFNDSLRVFLTWVKSYRENSLPFPLYLVLPSSPGNFTTVLGFGVLVAGYGVVSCSKLQRNQVPIRILLLLLTVFVCVLWLVGQPSTRFFLEPYVWTLLLLAMLWMALVPAWLRRLAKVALVCQTIVVVGALSFYAWGVLNSFAPGGQVAFLKKYVNGYDLHKWIDTQLPESAAVLLDHRSKTLTRRVALSADPIEFWGQDGIQLRQLEYDLTLNGVQFAITREESPIYPLLALCSSQILAGPETMYLASRNPFNSGGRYRAYIFLIEPHALIDCISNQKSQQKS
jgi:hypothetical protein